MRILSQEVENYKTGTFAVVSDDFITLDLTKQTPAQWTGEKWKDTKQAASTLAARLSMLASRDHAYKNRAERMAACSHYIRTMSCPDGHHHRVVRASLCRDRLCPTCGWRRARALAARTSQIMERVGGRYLMLTLTVVNPPDGALGATLRRMTKAFGELMRSPRLRGVVGGAIRTVEVTRSRGTWHPHIHALLRVEESYFRSALYLDHDEWLSLWRQTIGDQNITQVDIRAADHNAPVEVAKYITKAADLQRLTLDQLHELAQAVKSLRLWSTSGCMKIKESDIEEEMIETIDAEHVDKCPQCGAVLQPIDYEWTATGYHAMLWPVNWPMKRERPQEKKSARRRKRNEVAR